jgi:hypothetical protein
VKLARYTVSQVRVAASCPRIHYFDAEHTRRNELAKPSITRVWKNDFGTGGGSGGGARFHRIIERFNGLATKAEDVRAALDTADADAIEQAVRLFLNRECIDLEALAARPVPERQALILALSIYVRELAEIGALLRKRGVSAGDAREQLFGDQRRRVDVTFHVGGAEQVHVTGAIDYVFYDVRTESHRIVDYKLTPGDQPNNDLFQVCTYALMHHHQHGTKPDVAVFYLHPKRQMFEKRWDELQNERHKVYDLIASMVGWARYDEVGHKGLLPPGTVTQCRTCPWQGECETRLGPKANGDFDRRWKELAAGRGENAPVVDTTTPPARHDDDDDDDAEGNDIVLGTPSGLGSAAPSAPTAADAGGLLIGTTQGATQRERVVIDSAALMTHVAVVGAAGSGKTWMAKVVVEEAIRNGVPVLAIDPQGDLVQFLLARPEAEADSAYRREREEFLRRVEPRVFTPGTSHGIRLSLDPIRVPAPGDLDRIANVERREEETRTMLEQVAGNLVGLAKAGGDVDTQRTFVYQVLAMIARRLKPGATVTLQDIVAVVRDPEAAGIEEADYIVKKGEREKLGRKLHGLVEGPGSSLFTGGVRLDLGALAKPHTPGKIPLNVIYLNALTDDDQKHFFLASLASEIYRWMITSLAAPSGPDARPNLLFYIDEARDFIPAGGRKPPAKEPLIRLFTQGRKYGVACLLCTQSPRGVDYNVFGNASTKLIGRLEAAQDVERVAEWFATSGAAPAWLAGRNGATPGTFVGRWPGIPAELEGREIRSRPLFSAHKGAWSPDRVEREVDASGIRERFAK